MITLHFRTSIGRSPLWLGFLLIPLVFACFALSPTAHAVVPAPDGGYPGGNTAEGADALFSLTTGTSNTAIGRQALYSNTTGTFNTANGAQALYHNTTINGLTGSANTANGYQALLNNRNGSDNTATGVQALQGNISALGNTATGFQALNHNNGGFNTANGFGALKNNTSGAYNTAIGINALLHNTTSSHNIAVGVGAGENVTASFGSNIHIGHDGFADDENTIHIGFLQSKTYIAGIEGFDASNGSPVYINGGRLGLGPICPPGCQPSSERF